MFICNQPCSWLRVPYKHIHRTRCSCESIQADLSILGIEVTIKQEDWNVFLADRKSGNYSGMCREGWLADYNDPVNMLEIFTSDSGNNDMQLGK